MVVLLITISGIVGVFWIMSASTDLANSTADRIEAIQIARDGLEAFTNIRDTNWKLFSADYDNCWNTLNYNNLCIGDDSATYDITHNNSEGLSISKNINNQFELNVHDNSWWFSDDDYKTRFKVQKDSNGFYTQSWWVDFTPLYTRELNIEYLQSDNTTGDSNDPKMKLTTIVQWNDPGSNTTREIEMSTLLTNWKAER